MRISIIIPAFNEERLLGATLASVQTAQSVLWQRGWETELIVCDNNSTDRTGEIARAAGARVVFEPVNQIGRARNRGAAEAKGDWLIFVDADSRPSQELIADVACAIQSGDCLAGGSTVKLDGDYPVGASLVSLWNCLSRVFRLLAGSFIFCDVTAFRAAGGFSQKLFAGEELDLSQKLKPLARAAGKKLVILHRHPLVTSARKFHLYSARELVGFFVKATFSRQQVLTDRQACHAWYDGRR